jgi:oxepin-CoA hydrolase/3-oxo-5,6-dehydrosuberyl-CoA semialdehyde dehydrogenase
MNPAIGPGLMELEFKNMEAATLELENILERYEQFFENNPDIKTAHPTFGYLTKKEWDVFHQKHFIHHFSQFGLSD